MFFVMFLLCFFTALLTFCFYQYYFFVVIIIVVYYYFQMHYHNISLLIQYILFLFVSNQIFILFKIFSEFLFFIQNNFRVFISLIFYSK